MAPTETTFKKSEVALMGTLALVAMALVTIAVIPSLRTKVKETITFDNREVLTKVSGSLTDTGPEVTVLKIRNKENLSLEVYSKDEHGELALLSKIPLFESRDGFFLLKGSATNLALTDVDKDGTLEILAPTYDDQMVPRLNIFKYNATTKSFDRMSAPEGFSP